MQTGFSAIRIAGAMAGFLAVALWEIPPAVAEEAVSQEIPAGTNIEERVTPIERSYAVVHQHEGEKRYIHELRIVLNYSFSLL